MATYMYVLMTDDTTDYFASRACVQDNYVGKHRQQVCAYALHAVAALSQDAEAECMGYVI